MSFFSIAKGFHKLTSHPPPELTQKEQDRLRAITIYEKTKDVSLVCRTYGISRATVALHTEPRAAIIRAARMLSVLLMISAVVHHGITFVLLKLNPYVVHYVKTCLKGVVQDSARPPMLARFSLKRSVYLMEVLIRETVQLVMDYRNALYIQSQQ